MVFKKELPIDLKKATLDNSECWSGLLKLFKEITRDPEQVTKLLSVCKIFYGQGK